MEQRPKQKPARERSFDRGGPPASGGGGDDDEDPITPRSPNGETDPEARVGLGGTPLPDAAVERATARASANAAALTDVFAQFLDDDAPARPAAPPPPATRKKKKGE